VVRTAGTTTSVRADLCDEAIWLARQLHRLGPDPKTTGLLALLLLQDVRAAGRRDTDGRLLPYDEQDRTFLERRRRRQAKQLLAATGAAPPGPYRLQAAIALLHATAADAGAGALDRDRPAVRRPRPDRALTGRRGPPGLGGRPRPSRRARPRRPGARARRPRLGGPLECTSARKSDSGTYGGGGAEKILKRIRAWLSIRRQGVRRR